MPKYLTNSYSSYAPTKVGDTVREQALLSKVQASKYLEGKKEFSDVDGVLNNLSPAPGGDWALNNFKEYFKGKTEEADKEGNYEDMIGDAAKIVKTGYEDYGLDGVIKDISIYADNMKQVEEADIPENWKRTKKLEARVINPGYEIDEITGEKVPKRYTPVNIPSYVNVDKEVNSIVSGMQSSNMFDRNKDGSLIMNTDLLDNTGKVYIRKGETVSRERIAEYVTNHMNHEEVLRQGIKDQADMRVKEILYKTGSFTPEHFEGLVSLNNPFRRDSKEYETYNNQFVGAFNSQVKSEIDKADKNGDEIDVDRIYLNVARHLEEGMLKYNYVKNAMDKHGFENETITTFDVEDYEAEAGKTDKILESLDNSTYVGITVGSGDTKDAATINVSNLYDNKKTAVSQLQAARQRLANLLADRNSGGEVSQVSIDRAKLEVEKIQSDVETIDVIAEKQTSATFQALVNAGFRFKPKNTELEGLGNTKQSGNIESYEAWRRSAYETYMRDVRQVIAAGGDPGNHMNRFLKEINPDYQLPEGESRKDILSRIFGTKVNGETSILSEQDFYEVLEHKLNESLNGDGDYLPHGLNDYVSEFKNNYNKLTENNPEAINMFQNNQILHIEHTGTENSSKGVYDEYNRALKAIGLTISRDLGAFKTFDGTPLSQIIDGENKVLNGEIEVSLLNSPVGGDLAAFVEIPIKANGGVTKTQHLISLRTDNDNSETIKDLVHNSLSNLSTVLTKNKGKLSANKVNMLNAVNSIINITDGTTYRYNKMPLETAEEGYVSDDFEIADSTFNFVTYREGKGNNRNKFLISEQNVPGYTVTVNGDDPRKSTVDGVEKYGRGYLGYHINDLDPETLLPREGIKPKYFLDTEDEDSPVTIREVDGAKDVSMKDWFVPYDAGNAAKVREKITLDVATRRGTFNKDALPYEIMMPEPDKYIQNYVHAPTIQNRLSKQAEIYSPENGYTRLDSIAKPYEISTNSKLNFVALNEQGINRASKLFYDLRTYGLKPVITGAGRDANNEVSEGSHNSLHKKFGGLDILKNEAGIYLTTLSKAQLAEYGISSIKADYNDHIHIEFDSKYLKPFTPISKEQYNTLGL